MSGHQGQVSPVFAASAAVYEEPSIGRFAFTALRGMPRMMWMPNRRPMA